MIISRITGGLGNQMFQYALGRHLSIIHKCDLFLDCSYYSTNENFSNRGFELDNFNINAKILDNNHIGNKLIYSIKSKLSSPQVINERSFSFELDVLSLPRKIALHGYWQSEQYFLAIKNIIIEDLSLKIKIKPLFLDLVNQKNTVAVHFRLGDYINNQEVNEIHGVCDPDYYQKAFSFFHGTQENVSFYIFSDDIEWVKKNIHFPENSNFIKGNNHIEDFQLMRLCNHQIIANSTFSWWAAWLNLKSDKKIIAPKNWFKDTSRNSSDIIPSEWIKL
jgi:hypothetical protein